MLKVYLQGFSTGPRQPTFLKHHEQSLPEFGRFQRNRSLDACANILCTDD